MQLHIGIDDTDSTKGGCTTYIAARLVEKLTSLGGVRFTDYPNIIRLNPNIPYKTRGNAAVALRVEIQRTSYDVVQETALDEIETGSHIGQKGTDPAVVILVGKPTPEIKQFSRKALCDVLSERDAVKLVRSSGASAAAYGTELGLVGALAAVGQTLTQDHTFELIAYRRKENCGSPRQVDEASVVRMDKMTSPQTFNNYDYENKRMLIAPHGPDPVLFGIRGENAEIVTEAFRMVEVREPIERWAVFRTNHGTDAHLRVLTENSEVKPNRPAVLRGVVSGRPNRIPGGHVFFDLNAIGRTFTCAAYEPTGQFRETIANLLLGDEVTVYGGVRESAKGRSVTINLEKILIHQLVDKVRIENPTCPVCGKRLKSAGRGQGYRCEKCSLKMPDSTKRTTTEMRPIGTGLYVPTPKAHRHLTKPLCRYGQEKVWDHRPAIGRWHRP